MSIFKKSQEKIEAAKLYALLSDKTSNYTIDEIKETIKKQGYSEKVASIVVKMITDNKLPLKQETKKTLSRDEVLKEISLSVNNVSKEKIDVKDLKKDSEINKSKASLKDVHKVGFFTRVKNTLKRGYFFFEDNYYKMIDGVSKVIPINKLTDTIDKVFPSFILFLVILLLLFYLIFSGGLSFNKSWTIAVEVYNPSNVPLNNALVTLQIKDKNVSFASTDVFGEVIFYDFKSKKQNITLIVSKENYDPTEHVFKLNKNNLRQKVYLPIDTKNPLVPQNPAEEREIMFVENENTLITNSTLNVTFSCSNTEKTPTPKTTLVSTGKVIVNTPYACGSLRVSVTSNHFSAVTNKVIESNNKVNLTRINNDRGKLGFSVKNISGVALAGSEATVYNNSSSSVLLPLDSKTTDLYGLGEFSLEPKQYLLTISKEGYLTHPLKGPFTVTKNNTTNTEIRLFTLQELLDFDCSILKYQDYCIAGEIDCLNPHLKPFLKQNADGTCSIGRPGYISVTLKDANTGAPVYADIILDSKLKDTDNNYSIQEHIAQDTNHYTFNVLDFYNYRVRVLNTEDSGYLQPDPFVVNGIDTNVIIPLEFSSELNSGMIGVNVKNEGSNISNAKVYLYRKTNDSFDLVNLEPKFTNQFGDVNFNMQRANRDYYAYAIHNVVDKEGVSNIKKLDVNSFLKLSVDLKDIPKILNLKVTPNISYDINFYDAMHDPVTEYVVVNSDTNKQYYFTGSVNRVYAIVSSAGYTTYQTELITLIPDQEIFKTISLSTLASCENGKLDVLGLYDKSGVTTVNKIDFIENGLDKEYKVKLKYTSCLLDAEEKYAFIRAGNQTFIDDEYIFLVSEDIISEDVDVLRGYKFSGEHIPDFNIVSFNQTYNNDKQYNYSGDGYKWVKIDFIDLVPNILEFSVNIKFRETPIAPTDYYNLNYRSLSTIYGQTYSFDPTLPVSWNSIPIYPNGYFYAKTNKYLIPFENTDYIYQTKIKDFNGTVLPSYADGYAVSIDNYYKYDVEYLYLKNTSRNGKTLQTSVYTNNNLKYSSYGYLSSLGNSTPQQASSQGDLSEDNNNTVPLLLTGFLTLGGELPGSDNNTTDQGIYYHINVEDVNYSLPVVDINRGYFLRTYTLFRPTGFFENTTFSIPKIVTNLFTNFPTINTNVYSYYSDVNFVFEITTDVFNDQLIIGENNVSFKVLDNYGSPVSDVIVKYQKFGSELIPLGSTNAQGVLVNQNIYADIVDIDKNVNFYFIFSPEFGFVGNTVSRVKKIFSGYNILEDSINASANYYILTNKVVFSDINKTDYTIVKSTNISGNLEDLSFTGSSSIFNNSLIKSNMSLNNNIPKPITLNQTKVITSLILNQDVNQSGIFNNSYRNILKIGGSLQYLLDANTIIAVNNLGNINYTLSYPTPKKGVFKDENTFTVEIIKDLNPNISIDYNFSSSSSAVLKNITSSALPSFIDSSIFNNSLASSVNQSLSTSGKVIPIVFKFNDTYSGNYPSQGNIILTFNFLLSGKEVSFTEEVNLKVFDSSSLVDVFSIDNNILIYCTLSDCSENKKYSFKKNTDNYDITLLTSLTLVPEDQNINVNNLSSTLNLTKEAFNRNINYYYNFSSLTEDTTTGNTNTFFNFKILNNAVPDFNKSRPLAYTITKVALDETERDITFDYCLGVGGQEIGSDIFILGYCQAQKESCYTGEANLPKVFFNWGEKALDSGSWKTKCIGDSSNNMSSKYACDSLQMLLSIFNKIENGVTEAFYIKLMNDGISDDLLKDFIGHPTTIYNAYDKPHTDIFSVAAVNQGKFKIVINNDPNLKVYTPGIYKVMVYGNTNNTAYKGTISDQLIHINLIKELDLPSTELNVFHYMPFNGNLNKDGTRNGYGVKVISEDSVILNKDVNINYTNVNSPIKELKLINNNSLTGLRNTIKSEGKILFLESLPDDYIQMTYTPSYPIPIFSHLACLKDNNFSYSLLDNESSLNSVIGHSFLTWYKEDKIYKDMRYSGIEETRYILDTKNVLDSNIDINTMLYLPTALNISSMYFKINELNNNPNTKVFTKGNPSGVNQTSNILFSSSDHEVGNNLENLRTVEDLFEYIKQEKACIYKSPSRTYIKWIDSKVNFTVSENEGILDNISSLTYNCPTTSNP